MRAKHEENPLSFCHVSEMSRRSPRELWRASDAVCLDVDSTVCQDEAIDRLASLCGSSEAVSEWYVVVFNLNNQVIT